MFVSSCLVNFGLVVAHPPVWVRWVAVLRHLLFYSLSSSLCILPNQMFISHYVGMEP